MKLRHFLAFQLNTLMHYQLLATFLLMSGGNNNNSNKISVNIL